MTNFLAEVKELLKELSVMGEKMYLREITTGLLELAECPKHSANGSPSVTLGEQHSPKTVMTKPTLPSVFYRTLGKVENKKNPKK